MIVEIKKYTDTKLTLVVERLVSIEIESDYKSDGSEYRLQIETDKGYNSIWYGTKKDECQTAYNKIQDALNSFYRKDDIEAEIKKYLKNLQQ